MVQPARERLQQAVDRLIYGERDDPYAVVSRLGQGLEATVSPGAVLTIVAETVGQALKLPYAAVELTRDDRVIASVAVGSPRGDLERLPLVYQGETLGALVLAPRSPGEVFGSADRRLLEVLARQVGVAAHAARLTDDLRRSRERLVAAREEERRRLRRDLHDGLGPILAAVTLKLGAAANVVERDPTTAQAFLVELLTEVRRIRGDIRRLVDDLRPPALDELGLAGAIRGGVRDVAGSGNAAGTVISIEIPNSLYALPAAVEVAAYRITLEAVMNVSRHAAARACRVRVELDRSVEPLLALLIEDDGRGLPADYRAGVGLLSMRERATELGGQCIIEPRPNGGTRVQAWLPLPAA